VLPGPGRLEAWCLSATCPIRSLPGSQAGLGEIADVDAVAYFTLSGDDQSWLAGFNRTENGSA